MVELHYEIEISGEWRTVDHDIFRSWSGRRKINGQIYHGVVYDFLTDDEKISGHDAYEKYLLEK